MTGQVFKILPQDIWRAARAAGTVPLHGADADGEAFTVPQALTRRIA
ncbi:MAG: hypothetical protein ACPG30_03245 [Parvibaculales bacterium]